MLSSTFRPYTLLALSLALLLTSCRTRTSTPPPLTALDYAGDQQALVALDLEIARAGTEPARQAALVDRLITTLRDTRATPAARQAAAQRLSLFPAALLTGGENAAYFVTLLADPPQSNLGRLALDLAPGAAVDALYLRALESAPDAGRLGLVQSLGNRRVAAAVERLAALLDVADPALAAAAVKSLGQIGTAEALAALRRAPNPAAPAVVAARLAAADRLGGAAAAEEFRLLAGNLSVAPHLRAAAVRGLLFAEPDAAAEQFVAAIASGDAELKPVVIEAIAAHPSAQLVPALHRHLASWDAPTQAAVISALGRRGDAAAVPAAVEATRHADPAVRAAAIVALGQLPGSPATAGLLAGVAAGDDIDDAKLARQSLARLNGPGVAEAVLAGAESGETPLRVVFLEQIAARNMTGSLELLLRMRHDPSAHVRSAALGSLAEIAPASVQPAVLAWAVAATDTGEQGRALRALANVTLRHTDPTQRSAAIIQVLESATPAVIVRLLPVLPRIGGIESARSASRLALRDDPTVASAAVATLSRWSDPDALPLLVDVAEQTTSDPIRVAAARGAVGYLNRTRGLSSPELSALLSRLLAVARDDQVRSGLTYLLSRCSDDAALALAEKLKAEPALATVANDAVLGIRANRAGTPGLTATANTDQLDNLTDGRLNTRWAAPATLGQAITVDFHSTRPVRQVVLDGGTSQWGFPEQVEIIVSDDPKQMPPPAASVPGKQGKMTIDLPPGLRGRYLIIRHAVDDADSWWGMAELVID